MKWAVVAELKKRLGEAGGLGSVDTLMREALEMGRLRRLAQDDRAIELLEIGLEHRVEKLAGKPIATQLDPETGEEVEVFDHARMQIVGEYVAIARDQATPLGLHHDAYLASLAVKPRTRADDVRALRFLKAWCVKYRISETVEAISPRVAGQFMDGLSEVAGGNSPVTLNKYLRRLSRYWQWLLKRHYVDGNVWAGKTLEEPDAGWDTKERPLTDDEVLQLIQGPATPHMHDLMRIAALSGARLDAVVCLSVKDCQDGRFVFKPQKKEREPRACPIHPALTEIVARRTDGRAPDEPIFPEWPAPRGANSTRERSFKASNQFTDYRRSVKVDDIVPGKRRSRVNFHSFRRWFVTKAEQADQPEHIIAAVVGHRRGGITLGVYSSGPLMAQARRCVEAVQLPMHKSDGSNQSLREAARSAASG
jgi:integrase